ncbi:MAG TPA: flagellar biosynthesis protein FliO, partial [Paraburkholderia sp.]
MKRVASHVASFASFASFGLSALRKGLDRIALTAMAALALMFAPLAAHAADMNAVNNATKIASGVGAGTAVPTLGVGAVLQTIVGLLVVIGLV